MNTTDRLLTVADNIVNTLEMNTRAPGMCAHSVARYKFLRRQLAEERFTIAQRTLKYPNAIRKMQQELDDAVAQDQSKALATLPVPTPDYKQKLRQLESDWAFGNNGPLREFLHEAYELGLLAARKSDYAVLIKNIGTGKVTVSVGKADVQQSCAGEGCTQNHPCTYCQVGCG